MEQAIPENIPLLPKELEREILEMAARENKRTALFLTLLCRRAQIWIEKLIYADVVLWGSNVAAFVRTVNSRSPNFFRTHIRSLFLVHGIGELDAKRILSVCTGTVELAYWLGFPDPLLSVAASGALQPQKLSINVGLEVWKDTSPDFTFPLFKNVTLLEIISPRPVWITWTGFETLTFLTHLMLDMDGIDEEALDEAGTALIQIFDLCKHLQICLLVLSDDEILASDLELANSKLPDHRIVIIPDTSGMLGWEAYSSEVSRVENLVRISCH